VQNFIAGVASFLEICHAEWTKYVDAKRQQYPELNFFLIQQLVFLQQELVKPGQKYSK
jgi:hypothetical protein